MSIEISSCMLDDPMDVPFQSVAKPTIIGLFGVPGAGKTHLLGELKSNLASSKFLQFLREELENHLASSEFLFFEGSEVIASQLDGGLESFKALSHEDQEQVRQSAIRSIAIQCNNSGKTAIVTGHLTLQDGDVPPSLDDPQIVLGQADWESYTHIIYLDIDPNIVAARRKDDLISDTKIRPELSVANIKDWQVLEKNVLRRRCLQHEVLLAMVSLNGLVYRVAELIGNFERRSEENELIAAKREISKVVLDDSEGIDAVFVFDADKTLAPEDTGKLYWEKVVDDQPDNAAFTVSDIFRAHGYSYHAFRQAALLYHDDDAFSNNCSIIAERVTLYPAMRDLLLKLSQMKHVRVCILTCGLALVWRKVLSIARLPNIPVLGADRFNDEELIITPTVKGQLVEHLQDKHRKFVVAFGDSPIDLPMLRQADQAIVVAGPDSTRSKSMPDALLAAITNDGLRPSQVVLGGPEANPILPTEIPVLRLADLNLSRDRFPPLTFIHATSKPASQLLTTDTRDARVSGPALRAAHRRVGHYLALEYLSGLMGLESTTMPHTTGGTTTGHRVRDETATLLVPLMRGGEPLAQGVSDVLPLAALVHAHDPEDLLPRHLRGRRAVVLVDSVINSGKSIVEFVARVRALDRFVPIFVVAGVVQAGAVASGGPLHRASVRYGAVSFVALRVSENSYKGVGGTDTGNRLFNTTYLD